MSATHFTICQCLHQFTAFYERSGDTCVCDNMTIFGSGGSATGADFSVAEKPRWRPVMQ